RKASAARPDERSKEVSVDKPVLDKVFGSCSLQYSIVAFFLAESLMIHSMTAFGSGVAENIHGNLKIECRTVNSRFLDIHIRLPDDLRFLEGRLREQITSRMLRGKVDLRLSHEQAEATQAVTLPQSYLTHLAGQLVAAREIMPDVRAPELLALLDHAAGHQKRDLDTEVWVALCDEACTQAMQQLLDARQREGRRLAATMLEAAGSMTEMVDAVEKDMPTILAAHQQKIVDSLQEWLSAVSPDRKGHRLNTSYASIPS